MTDPLQNAVIDLLPNHDDYTIGFGDMGELLKDVYPFRYVLVILAKLNDEVMDSISDGPTRDYYLLYQQTNNGLNELAANISALLKSNDIPNLPIPATLADDEIDARYLRTLRYKFSHKMGATRAGLGWIGKTALLVSERFGPRVRMASVLTNFPFSPLGTPITESRCGDCNICVERCPAGAATGKLWNTSIDRDEFFHAAKCREMCRKKSLEKLRQEISLCGICVAACPQGLRKRGR